MMSRALDRPEIRWKYDIVKDIKNMKLTYWTLKFRTSQNGENLLRMPILLINRIVLPIKGQEETVLLYELP